MRRTNLIIDEELLKKVIQLFGINNYSQAVNRSMEEVIKFYKMKEIINYHGMNIWEGKLSQTREDKKNSYESRAAKTSPLADRTVNRIAMPAHSRRRASSKRRKK